MDGAGKGKWLSLLPLDRVIFNWVLKVISECFDFALLFYVIGPKKLKVPSLPIKFKLIGTLHSQDSYVLRDVI